MGSDIPGFEGAAPREGKAKQAGGVGLRELPFSLPAGIGPLPYCGSVLPIGRWLWADGSIKKRGEYPDLFRAISTQFNIGGEATDEFRLPKADGRVPVFRDSTQVEFDTLGETGGAKTHALGAAEIPAHTHPGPSHTHAIDHDHAAATSAAESGHTHAINHDHGAVGTSDPGQHTHTMNFFTVAIAETPTAGATTFRWINDAFDQQKSTDGAGGHNHSVDLPNFVGSSGASTGHTHSVNLPNFVGSSGASGTDPTGSTGGGGAHPNLQPFMVFNAIISY